MKIIRKYIPINNNNIEIKMSINVNLDALIITIKPISVYHKYLNQIFSTSISASIYIKHQDDWIDSKPYEDALYKELMDKFKYHLKDKNIKLKKEIKLVNSYNNLDFPNTINKLERKNKLKNIINE